MWVDTHCHLDASEYDGDRDAVVAQAHAAGVGGIVIPAIARSNFDVVQTLAHRVDGGCYALGIHPMLTAAAQDDDLLALRRAVERAMDDRRFVAIGEIGLDFFVTGLSEPRQTFFYVEQLKLAREFDLPVLLHVRRSQDKLLKQLRRFRDVRGIAHAFNGSQQQAEAFVDLGFKLGFGGAMTFPRALQIRRLAASLPAEALVLETDGPDISPEWINRQRNAPGELPRIAETLCALRGLSLDDVRRLTFRNACEALPRMANALVASGAMSTPAVHGLD